MNEDIVAEKFKEWTKGLSEKEARIAVFEHVRDIPYLIVPRLKDPHKGPSGILLEGKGSCTPKHFLLALMFKKLDIPVKFATYIFSWNDPDITYPPGLRKLAKVLPLEYHLACKAFINNKWIIIDTTWDPPLKRVGFPVNETWDGESDTLLAVKPMEEVVHDDVFGRVQFVKEKKSFYTQEEEQMHGEFIRELNQWLEKLRPPNHVGFGV
ncbi:MAG: transglutaminase domain-containing protein [Candidatus Omnitrophica bacterium]|nr:transglutaminase domain-containing protein [Candidatus Omnitrophota bacterium]